jgi:hypothetical protein
MNSQISKWDSTCCYHPISLISVICWNTDLKSVKGLITSLVFVLFVILVQYPTDQWWPFKNSSMVFFCLNGSSQALKRQADWHRRSYIGMSLWGHASNNYSVAIKPRLSDYGKLQLINRHWFHWFISYRPSSKSVQHKLQDFLLIGQLLWTCSFRREVRILNVFVTSHHLAEVLEAWLDSHLKGNPTSLHPSSPVGLYCLQSSFLHVHHSNVCLFFF